MTTNGLWRCATCGAAHPISVAACPECSTRRMLGTLPDGPVCGECGSSDTVPIEGRRGEVAPGEWCRYECNDCDGRHWAIMPEPADNYAGDGVFAENH